MVEWVGDEISCVVVDVIGGCAGDIGESGEVAGGIAEGSESVGVIGGVVGVGKLVEDSDGLSASALESLEVSVWIVGVCGGDLRVLGALIQAMSCPDSVELVV